MSILEDYEDIPVAEPKPYNMEEEMRKKISTQAQNRRLGKLPQQDADLGRFGSLVTGKGVEQEV